MKKKLYIVVALAILCLCLASCGKPAATETTTAAEETTASAAETTAAVSETTTAVEETTATAPETTVAEVEPAGPALPAGNHEKLFVYLDGVALNEAGYDYADVSEGAVEQIVGSSVIFGSKLSEALKDVDMSAVKGVFFEAADGFISYGGDMDKVFLGGYVKEGGNFAAPAIDGKSYYFGGIDGGISCNCLSKIYLVTTAADWSVIIQADGKTIGELTMDDYMRKTTVNDQKLATGYFDSSFVYNAGSSTYEGSFLGFGYEQMVAKLVGMKLALPENIADVEFYGTVGTGSEGKNTEYAVKASDEKYFGNVAFFCMFDGKTMNDITGTPVGLTAFIPGTGLRWLTGNLNTINFISAAAEEPAATTAAEPEKTTAAEPEKTTAAEPEKTTAAEPEKTTAAEPEKTTAAEPEKTTAAEPEKTTAAEPEQPAAAAVPASNHEKLFIYLDGELVKDGGYDFADISAAAKEFTLAGDTFYGMTLAETAKDVDMSAVKGVFFEAADGFLSYGADVSKAYVAGFVKEGGNFSAPQVDGKDYYVGVIDGGMTNKGVKNIYLVTTSADWTVDIQIDGTSAGKLTMSDFMKKTHMPDESRIPTGWFDGGFKYNGGADYYEGRFLGFGYEQMLNKLSGLKIALPDAASIKEVEYYGINGSGVEGKNTEYSTKSKDAKYYGNVDFFCMYDGMTYNSNAGQPVGLTAFINTSGMRWMTCNINTINFVTK